MWLARPFDEEAPPVFRTSALTGEGLDEFEADVLARVRAGGAPGWSSASRTSSLAGWTTSGVVSAPGSSTPSSADLRRSSRRAAATTLRSKRSVGRSWRRCDPRGERPSLPEARGSLESHRVLGVDAAGKHGWIGIVVDDDGFVGARAGGLRAIIDWAEPVAAIGVDIPIGHVRGGVRRADVEARRFVGPRRAASVFAAPPASALGAASYAEANEVLGATASRGCRGRRGRWSRRWPRPPRWRPPTTGFARSTRRCRSPS